jgi:ADP-heptose:LPS heptosyltransferase/glycosyltransferase involved in cell wall biosynthesis
MAQTQKAVLATSAVEVLPSCPVCATAVLARYGTSPYWTCPSCDCWFQSPMPPKTYEASHEKDEEGGFTGHLMSDRDKAVNRHLAGSLFKDWLKGKPGKTLDVGSKYPYLAHCLKELGCEAFGMDNIEIVPEYSRDLGVPMLMADFESISEDQIREWTKTEKFSLITMVHVFEHMYEPLEALRKLRKLITDDGTLFIRLPDHSVAGFERDLTEGHYTIHPFFHSLSSLLELLVQGQDLFTVRLSYPMVGSGQRDLMLKPLAKKPVIYAGLIVKNEERDLPRCLKSIETVVDGAVVVDTGSTDKTLDVARATTKLPVHAQTYTGASRQDDKGDWKIWDFSKARNVFVEEIEKHGADYVLWVDADDELLTPDHIRRALYWDQYDVFGIQVESGGSRWTHHRVWKTGRGIHFQGRCHEYPTYGGHASIVLTDSVMRHHAEPGAGENSNARNMRILLEEFAEAPSPRTAFYLANTYKDASRHAEAVPWYDKRIAFGKGYRDEWLFAHLYKGRCQHWAKNLAGAKTTMLQAIAEAPDWSEFWMELAYIAYDQRDYYETIGYALIARDKPRPPTQLWREPNKYIDQPLRLISWCYEHLGDVANALMWAERAKEKIGARDVEWDDRIARLLRGEIDDAAAAAAAAAAAEDDVTDEGDDAPRVEAQGRTKIAICRPGAIGDVLMTLNLVPLLLQKWPDHDLHYYCHPSIGSELKDLLLAVGVAEVRDSTRFDASGYSSVFNLVGYPLHEGYPEKPMQRHLLDYFANELGIVVDSAALPSLVLPLPPTPPGPSGPYATLQAKTGWSAYKNWPIDRWAEVVASCSEIPIYQIGTADEPRVEGARHDFMGSPLPTSIALVANASLHLGLDSFANHLTHYRWDDGSSVRRVPGIILWGSTQASASGYDHNTNISLGLSCQPCFREDPAVSRMPRGPCINPQGQLYALPQHACMLGIDPERVTREVKALWTQPSI